MYEAPKAVYSVWRFSEKVFSNNACLAVLGTCRVRKSVGSGLALLARSEPERRRGHDAPSRVPPRPAGKRRRVA